MTEFGLPQRTLNEMCAIFAKHSKVKKVVIYGSRAMGNYKTGSDIDLTMHGEDLTYHDLSRIAGELDDSSIPYLVDLSIYDALDHVKLKDHINRRGQVFYDRYAGWETVKLGCVCDFIGGGTPNKKKTKYYGGDILWATVRDMGGDYIQSTEHSITSEGLLNSSSKVIPKDNIVIASRVGLGKVCILKNDTAINQDLRGVIPKSKSDLDFKFLFYYFKSISDFIIAAGRGATVQGVTLPFLKSLKIPLPPLAEQQRIVAKLDAAFVEIDTQLQTLKTKKDNVQLLLNQFLATINANPVKLVDIVQIKTGKLDANAMVEGGEYPFFTCSKQVFEIDNYAFDCDAVLLAGNNASGDFNVKYYIGKFNAYQRTYVITVKNENRLRSRYLYFQLIQALAKFKEMSVGTNTQFLKLGMIKNFEIPLPELGQQDSILIKLDGLDKNIQQLNKNYEEQLHNLVTLKSAILTQELQSEAA